MADLVISTAAPLGPLSVNVFGPDGAVGKGLLLSSITRQTTLVGVSPGDYTVVAARPSGEELLTRVNVGEEGGFALIGAGTDFARSSSADFGLLLPSQTMGSNLLLDVAAGTARTANNVVQSFGALLSSSAKSLVRAAAAEGLVEYEGAVGPLQLVAWSFGERRWRRDYRLHGFPIHVEGDLLTIDVQSRIPLALGLLDANGFGPIVVAPPFREGAVVTFLSAGLEFAGAADRVSNPSAVRVPVAAVMPREAEVADLMVGLAAPALPHAVELLENGRGGDAASALDLLLHKHRDPAAAVLAALFLARFAPTRLPMAWLKNLVGILPDIADTHLLLAWARSVQESDSGDWQETVVERLRAATASRCVLFARTRYQLTRMTRIYGPKPRARRTKVVTPRRWRSGDYLDFAAEAGGVEAFWGSTPFRPGPDAARPPRPGLAFTLEGGRFHEAIYPDPFEYLSPFAHDYLVPTAKASPEEAAPFQLTGEPDVAATFEFSFGLEISGGDISEDDVGPEIRVHLHFEPGERNSGFRFRTNLSSLEDDETSAAMIEASVERALRTGIDGRPVVDMIVVLDRLELTRAAEFGSAFEEAVRNGLANLAMQRPFIPLERMAQLDIMIAEQFVGDLISEVNTRKGVMQGSHGEGGRENIQVLVSYQMLEGFDEALRAISPAAQYRQKAAGYREQPSDSAASEAGGLAQI